MIVKVYVPRETVSDTSVQVVSVPVASGEVVDKGQVIFDLETSKAVFEVEAPVSGTLIHNVMVGTFVDVGCEVARIETGEVVDHEETDMFIEPNQYDRAIASKAALKLAKDNGFDISSIKSAFITAADIQNSLRVASGAHLKMHTAGKIRGGNKVVILGGGGHSKMCIEVLKLRREFSIVGIVDSEKPIGSLVCGVPVIGRNDSLRRLYDEGVTHAVNGVGSVLLPEIREELYLRLKSIGFSVPNIVHPSAVIESSAILGEGNHIMMGACIGSDVVVGNNCIVNSGVIVSHDSVIGDHVQLSPGAILAGNVTVRNTSVIGMGSTIYIGVTIGDKSVIANGVNVFKDVSNDSVVKGK